MAFFNLCIPHIPHLLGEQTEMNRAFILEGGGVLQILSSLLVDPFQVTQKSRNPDKDFGFIFLVTNLTILTSASAQLWNTTLTS